MLVLRLVICAAVFLFGLLMIATGAITSADAYGQAGTMAAAPTCPAGVDVIANSTDCVGNAVLSAQDGMYPDNDEESLDLIVPDKDGGFLFPDYPGNAAFDAVLGDSDTYPVRAEFWEGNLVTLTAARATDVQSVTTDANPNNQGGVDLGIAMMGLALADLGALLLIGVRAVRYRWLRPGLGLRLSVSAMIVVGIGLFVASTCQIIQPALVLRTMTIVPIVVAGLTLLVWFTVYSSFKTRGLRPSAVRRR